MYYQEKISYAGEPLKAIVGDGVYVYTPFADDVPVTRIQIAELLGAFSFGFKLDRWARESGIRLAFRSPRPLPGISIIGEQVIILETWGILLENSIEARAKRFEFEIRETDEHICLIVSDDGEGVHPSVEGKILVEMATTKNDGFGWSLLLASRQLPKIGAGLEYRGAGLDGRGASFALTFLREMPG